MAKQFDQRTADDLMNEAFDALSVGSPEVALKIGKSLRGVRYSGCFEIEALAYADLGKRAKAIEVLKEGTEKCPDVWPLWQLLGNYLSDDDRFEEALAAYDCGLKTSQSFVESLYLNAAITLIRSGDPTAAKATVAKIIEKPDFDALDGSLRARALAVELEALRRLNDCSRAVHRFEGLHEQEFGEDAAGELSMLWAEYARSLLELGRRNEAERAALQASRLHQQNNEALWVLREVRRATGDAAVNYYKVMVKGDWPQVAEGERAFDGFFATYHVCADSEAEVLGFIEELQPDGVANLQTEEIEQVETTHDPKGVYFCGSYASYREDE